MAKKSVQIVGACWVNLGDRLMVKALRNQLGKAYNLPLPIYLNTPATRFWGPKNISLMMVQGVFRCFQYLKLGKPGLLLDCSGYQYGDPWAAAGKVLSLRLLMYQYFRAKGGRIILLPQSLGPFRHRTMASTAAGIFQIADLVFARDDVSRQHALDVGCPPSRIHIMPDYSIMADPVMPPQPGEWANRVGIVPSVRMLDKTSQGTASIYLSALRKCVHWIRDRGLEPYILVHDLEDRALAKALHNEFRENTMLLKPSPAEAKGIIASSKALVASRYHALVAALSQGVPVIGTGWTHKYRVLFQDYHCEACLVEHLESDTVLEDMLGTITEEPARSQIIEKLRQGSEKHRARTKEMFTMLTAALDGQGSL